MRQAARIVVILGVLISTAHAANLEFKEKFGKLLLNSVPGMLKSYDPATGHFGEGVWICTDQNLMYPLAVAYTLDVPGNKYHRDPKLLEVLMKAGDALAADADAQGRWVFRKKDNSTWGMIHMPWTYSRWVRTYGLIRDDMPTDRRAAWEKALLNGYENISKSGLGAVHNIPTHHAMGLYIAGKLFERPQWCEQAAAFLKKVAGKQSENGYWAEGQGPVVNYNFVYVDAIGTYYALSKDESVRETLRRASEFHRNFTYPNGVCVETIDQRNPLHAIVNQANVGFCFDPVGRAYLASQWAHVADKEFKPDIIASFISYGQEGEIDVPDSKTARVHVLNEGGADRAMTIRQGPWFICLSAFTTPVSKDRWIQDRQNLVSIYHDKTGPLIGGGNTKLQPAWSNFTVGDPSLLKHTPGDTSPKFLPAGELYHVPSAATIVRDPVPGLDLTYGPQQCHIRVQIKSDNELEYVASTSQVGQLPVVARVTLLPRMGETIKTGEGRAYKLDDETISVEPAELKGSLLYANCKLTLPQVTGLYWPALPHNPYVRDGRAKIHEGRIELRMPFSQDRLEHRVLLSVE